MNIDDKVDFSTIRIGIQEVERLRNAETVETTFGTRILNAIEDSIFAFKKGMQNFLISLIYLFPFIIVFGVFLLALYFIIRRIRRNNQKIDK